MFLKCWWMWCWRSCISSFVCFIHWSHVHELYVHVSTSLTCLWLPHRGEVWWMRLVHMTDETYKLLFCSVHMCFLSCTLNTLVTCYQCGFVGHWFPNMTHFHTEIKNRVMHHAGWTVMFYILLSDCTFKFVLKI